MNILFDSLRFGIEAKKKIRDEINSEIIKAWMAERVVYDGMTVMRTFQVEVRESDYMWHLVANNTPEYHRAMEILSYYGIESGMAFKGRMLICKERNSAMSYCWQESDRPILGPPVVEGDSVTHILQQFRNYDVVDEIKYYARRKGIMGEVQRIKSGP